MSHEVNFIEQGHEILGYYGDMDCCYQYEPDEPTNFIASVARTCYKSKPKAEGIDSPYSDVRAEAERDANERLVKSLIKHGHHAMLEHSFLSVRFVTDRAIANEIVRHRHFSFAQESSRYVNYDKKGFEFILPEGLDDDEDAMVRATCHEAAERYEFLVEHGMKPEIARSVLPLSLATTLVVSGNFREWRHCFKLRCDKHAHPQMRSLMKPLVKDLHTLIPIIFDDINVGTD